MNTANNSGSNGTGDSGSNSNGNGNGNGSNSNDSNTVLNISLYGRTLGTCWGGDTDWV